MAEATGVGLRKRESWSSIGRDLGGCGNEYLEGECGDEKLRCDEKICCGDGGGSGGDGCRDVGFGKSDECAGDGGGAADALPGYSWGQDCLQLWRGFVAGGERRRSGAADYHASWDGAVSEIFAGREDDCVHGAVRREFRRVHDTGGGRRAEAIDVSTAWHAHRGTHGAGRRSDQLDAGWEAHPVSFAARHVQ